MMENVQDLLIESRGKSKNPICNICAAYWTLRTSKRTGFTHCRKPQQVVSNNKFNWWSKFNKNGLRSSMATRFRKIKRNLQQKCRHGRRIAAVGDSKHTLHTWELASPFPTYLSSFSFISCMRAWIHEVHTKNNISKTMHLHFKLKDFLFNNLVKAVCFVRTNGPHNQASWFGKYRYCCKTLFHFFPLSFFHF